MSKHGDSELARKRAEIIFQVRGGLITATEGARLLGIARKNFYKWEKKALEAVVEALTDQPAGRPALPQDPEKESLRQQNEDLRSRLFLLEKKLNLKDRIASLERQANESGLPKKTKRKKRKRRSKS